ncbi:hypothetical protein [Coxiella-like endosymbiont of Rhipicephalus sanguineus]|uniref:hypothetical protein n=1 Tax=Coxiella-like endosymbiont of Rhipicephalus sanguineus TaxID=1955402 RepID=UPI003556C65E
MPRRGERRRYSGERPRRSSSGAAHPGTLNAIILEAAIVVVHVGVPGAGAEITIDVAAKVVILDTTCNSRGLRPLH